MYDRGDRKMNLKDLASRTDKISLHVKSVHIYMCGFFYACKARGATILYQYVKLACGVNRMARLPIKRRPNFTGRGFFILGVT